MRNEAAIVALAAGLSVVAASFLLTEGHTWGDDFSAYVMQARSLVEGSPGEFVERNTFTVESSSWAFGPHAYPWGFPLLLAPLYAAFGPNLLVFKLLNLACYAAFLFVLWRWLLPRLGPVDRLLVVALFASCPGLLPYTDQVMSDIPFLLLSTAALWQIDRCTRGERRPAGLAVAGTLVLAATTVRTNGALLLPALLVADLVARGREETARDAVVRAAIPTAVLVVGSALWSLAFGSGDVSHLSVLAKASPSLVVDNVGYYLQLPEDFFGVLPSAVYYATLPFLAIGMVRGGLRESHLLVYAGLTVALYMLTPFRQGIRYLFPVLPIYVYFALLGMRAVASASTRFSRGLGAAADVFWCGVLVCFAWICVEYAGQNLATGRAVEGPFDAQSSEMFDWIESETPRDAVVVFFKARVLRMQTGRDAIMIDDYRDLARGHYYVFHKQAGAKYQVPLRDLQRPAIASRLRKRWENGRFVVFEIEGGGAARS